MKIATLILFLTINISVAFDYFQYGGLVTKRDPTTENMNLFLAEYLTVGGKIEKEYFEKGMENRRLCSGLYLRSPLHNNRTVSHDEITGLIISSKILNTDHRFEIWNQLVKNFGAYPAVVNDWTDYLPYNPANYYSWAMITGHENIAQLYLPIFTINFFITINKPYEDTSGKIMLWLELANMPINFINDAFIKKFDKEMTKMYGQNWLYKLMKIYHGDDEFPVLKQIKEIEQTKTILN